MAVPRLAAAQPVILGEQYQVMTIELPDDAEGPEVATLDLRQCGLSLGSHVSCIRIAGGLHDLMLSRAPVRRRVLDEIERWTTAYASGL